MNAEDKFFNKYYLSTYPNTAMKINSTTGKRYDFKGPADSETNSYDDLKFPITESVTSASAATVNLAPKYRETYVAQAVAAAMTINVATTDAKLGDKLFMVITVDGTDRTITWGTGVTPQSATVGGSGSASKKYAITLFFNGTAWIEMHRSAAF